MRRLVLPALLVRVFLAAALFLAAGPGAVVGLLLIGEFVIIMVAARPAAQSNPA